jgi:Protein of unknown function (DUF1360)
VDTSGSVIERLDAIRSWARHEADCYRSTTDEPRPLGAYLATMAAYASALASVVAIGRFRKVRLPARVTPWDVAVTGVAVHKLSRVLAKDPVTTPLRAPFTTFEGRAGEAEVNERVREHGQVRHAVGELVTCPFCLAQWVATGFVAGFVLAPKVTRLASWTMASVAVADFLQLGYAALQKRAE